VDLVSCFHLANIEFQILGPVVVLPTTAAGFDGGRDKKGTSIFYVAGIEGSHLFKRDSDSVAAVQSPPTDQGRYSELWLS